MGLFSLVLFVWPKIDKNMRFTKFLNFGRFWLRALARMGWNVTHQECLGFCFLARERKPPICERRCLEGPQAAGGKTTLAAEGDGGGGHGGRGRGGRVLLEILVRAPPPPAPIETVCGCLCSSADAAEQRLSLRVRSVGHKGKFGHEFLEFEFRPDGKLRYANKCVRPPPRPVRIRLSVL